MDSATRLSFRKVVEEVARYAAGVLGASTVHRFDELDGYGTALPALEGTHASRPWAKVLKSMTSAYNPLLRK